MPISKTKKKHGVWWYVKLAVATVLLVILTPVLLLVALYTIFLPVSNHYSLQRFTKLDIHISKTYANISQNARENDNGQWKYSTWCTTPNYFLSLDYHCSNAIALSLGYDLEIDTYQEINSYYQNLLKNDPNINIVSSNEREISFIEPISNIYCSYISNPSGVSKTYSEDSIFISKSAGKIIIECEESSNHPWYSTATDRYDLYDKPIDTTVYRESANQIH
jgi:hypothetical protein